MLNFYICDHHSEVACKIGDETSMKHKSLAKCRHFALIAMCKSFIPVFRATILNCSKLVKAQKFLCCNLTLDDLSFPLCRRDPTSIHFLLSLYALSSCLFLRSLGSQLEVANCCAGRVKLLPILSSGQVDQKKRPST